MSDHDLAECRRRIAADADRKRAKYDANPARCPKCDQAAYGWSRDGNGPLKLEPCGHYIAQLIFDADGLLAEIVAL